MEHGQTSASPDRDIALSTATLTSESSTVTFLQLYSALVSMVSPAGLGSGVEDREKKDPIAVRDVKQNLCLRDEYTQQSALLVHEGGKRVGSAKPATLSQLGN
jgi:hypothetical protein